MSRSSFQTLAMVSSEPVIVTVRAQSPYKTLNELIDAAKAKPGTIKVGTNGIMSSTHVAWVLLEKSAGVKFAAVHFGGAGEQLPAGLGGHIDAMMTTMASAAGHIKEGTMVVLGVGDTERTKALPDVKTFPELGYPGTKAASTRGFVGPAGIPMETVRVWSDTVKVVTSNPEFLQKAQSAGLDPKYMDFEGYGKDWDSMDAAMKPVYEEVWAEQKNPS